ncbi:hypothetical protein JOD54_003072 [Actinokineospora baliensis]|nr:hypothetical protein [Actinokineospora baliensis]
MTRLWKDVKAEKARRDGAGGRDLEAACAEARTRTQAYVLERELVRRVKEQGVECTVRDTRGQEIAAACGQHAAEG